MISIGISEFGERDFAAANIKEQQIENYVFRRRRKLGEVFAPLSSDNLAGYDFEKLFTSQHVKFHPDLATKSENRFLLFTNDYTKELLTQNFTLEVDSTFPHGYFGTFSQIGIRSRFNIQP